MSQKALIIRTGSEGHDGLEALNIELGRGWRVAEATPMGGAGGATEGASHAALVILEHRDPDEAGRSVAAESEETVEEVVEDVVEGDGASAGPPESPSP